MTEFLTDDEVRERFKVFDAKHPGGSWGLYSALAHRGHSDEAILDMDESTMFDEFCQWHGLLGWGPTLRAIMEDAKAMPVPEGGEV